MSAFNVEIFEMRYQMKSCTFLFSQHNYNIKISLGRDYTYKMNNILHISFFLRECDKAKTFHIYFLKHLQIQNTTDN